MFWLWFAILGMLFGFLYRELLYEKKLARKLNQLEEDIRTQLNISLSSKEQMIEKIDEKRKYLEETLAHSKKIYDEKNILLSEREKYLQQKNTDFNLRTSEIVQFESILKKEIESLDESKNIVEQTLIKKSKTSLDDAHKEIRIALQSSLEQDFSEKILRASQVDEFEYEELAKNMVLSMVQRYSYKNAERVSMVPIPLSKKLWSDLQPLFALLKKVSEVDLEYDEEENNLYVVHYNLVRKTIAHEALVQLMKHKTHDEKTLKVSLKTASDKIHDQMIVLGKQALRTLRMEKQNWSENFIKLIGRMHFRTSYGQNILQHSIEVAFFCRLIALEIGVDPVSSMIAGLLHDIGKSVDQDREGTHDLITKELMEAEGGFDEVTLHAAWNHHNIEENKYIEGLIVQIADAISAARPGSRMESADTFSKRLSMLEEKAYQIHGVKKAFAIQGGRELRALFDHKAVDDKRMQELVTLLAQNIEKEGGYPGQIMVHGIRELRIQEIANIRNERTKKTK